MWKCQGHEDEIVPNSKDVNFCYLLQINAACLKSLRLTILAEGVYLPLVCQIFPLGSLKQDGKLLYIKTNN